MQTENLFYVFLFDIARIDVWIEKKKKKILIKTTNIIIDS
jgi:hypothetical protein